MVEEAAPRPPPRNPAPMGGAGGGPASVAGSINESEKADFIEAFFGDEANTPLYLYMRSIKAIKFDLTVTPVVLEDEAAFISQWGVSAYRRMVKLGFFVEATTPAMASEMPDAVDA
jgi:hypothetical protein